MCHSNYLNSNKMLWDKVNFTYLGGERLLGLHAEFVLLRRALGHLVAGYRNWDGLTFIAPHRRSLPVWICLIVFQPLQLDFFDCFSRGLCLHQISVARWPIQLLFSCFVKVWRGNYRRRVDCIHLLIVWLVLVFKLCEWDLLVVALMCRSERYFTQVASNGG